MQGDQEDPVGLMSELYSGLYTQMAPQQGNFDHD